jgi:hypothetical protein
MAKIKQIKKLSAKNIINLYTTINYSICLILEFYTLYLFYTFLFFPNISPRMAEKV